MTDWQETLIEVVIEENVPYGKGTTQQKQKALEILEHALTDVRAGRKVPWTRDYERLAPPTEKQTGLRMRSANSYL